MKHSLGRCSVNLHEAPQSSLSLDLQSAMFSVVKSLRSQHRSGAAKHLVVRAATPGRRCCHIDAIINHRNGLYKGVVWYVVDGAA